jgi:hypothetical protein
MSKYCAFVIQQSQAISSLVTAIVIVIPTINHVPTLITIILSVNNHMYMKGALDNTNILSGIKLPTLFQLFQHNYNNGNHHHQSTGTKVNFDVF